MEKTWMDELAIVIGIILFCASLALCMRRKKKMESSTSTFGKPPNEMGIEYEVMK